MNALSRLLPTIERHGAQQLCTSRIVHEIASTYDEAIAEYRCNMREQWLLQEISGCVKRLNVLRAMQIFERENEWHPAVFRREIARNNRMLREHREELRKLRSE